MTNCRQRIALAALTPNRVAAARHDIPPSTAATTRSRRSCDSTRGIHAGLRPGTEPESENQTRVNPQRFRRHGNRSKRSGWFPDRAVELPFPASGTVTVNNSVDPKTATSKIKVTAGEANAVVQLFDRKTDAHVISVYVNRNEDVSVPVPPGTYRMKIVEGDKWHGLTTWFGPSTTYETVVKPMVFTRQRYPMIDLHRSPASNLTTSINITNPKPLN